MDLLALASGFAVPWALGAVLLYALARPAGPGDATWTIGCGWFLGIFLLTLWMRVLSRAGMAFTVVWIVLPLLVVAGLLLAFAWRRGISPAGEALREAGRTLRGAQLHGAYRVAWLALLGWLAARFLLLLTEVMLRPLYPWDAWTQWGTKARVWFETRTMAPFVGVSEWLSAQSPNVYFDAAPHYPATVPLTQVFGALLIGRWDDALVNFPWWLTGIAFAFALYGALAQRRFPPLLALLGTWLVLSLPILNVHIALAGYADLAMSAYFTLAALAALRWTETRRMSDAVTALLLAAACILVKNPGIVWVLILVPGVFVALTPRWGLKVVAAGAALGALSLALFAQTGAFVLGYQIQGAFKLPWSALSDAYLLFGNWNLLWYGVLATFALAWRHAFSPALAPLTVIVLGGIAFLFFGFSFTQAAAWVEDQSTVNRATLHLAPLLLVWMMLTVRAWLGQGATLRSSRPSATAPG